MARIVVVADLGSLLEVADLEGARVLTVHHGYETAVEEPLHNVGLLIRLCKCATGYERGALR